MYKTTETNERKLAFSDRQGEVAPQAERGAAVLGFGQEAIAAAAAEWFQCAQRCCLKVLCGL